MAKNLSFQQMHFWDLNGRWEKQEDGTEKFIPFPYNPPKQRFGSDYEEQILEKSESEYD